MKEHELKTIEHPILFSTEMIQAYKAGRKTQTRRLNIRGKWNPGEKLWFKETYQIVDGKVFYKADTEKGDPETDIKPVIGWKPSIFMNRKYSRFNPKIISIRQERLLDISEKDAIAEGIEGGYTDDDYEYTDYLGEGSFSNPVTSYFSLWDKINGKDSHKDNPLVRVIEFEGLEEIK